MQRLNDTGRMIGDLIGEQVNAEHPPRLILKALAELPHWWSPTVIQGSNC
jgi:hypothetical protein